jgi:hypothetical protein
MHYLLYLLFYRFPLYFSGKHMHYLLYLLFYRFPLLVLAVGAPPFRIRRGKLFVYPKAEAIKTRPWLPYLPTPHEAGVNPRLKTSPDALFFSFPGVHGEPVLAFYIIEIQWFSCKKYHFVSSVR